MNREQWLALTANKLRPIFQKAGAPLPDNIRCAIGWPSTGRRSKRIGECWSAEASAGNMHEIFIHPGQAKALEVAAILAHELTHAAVGLEAKHGKPFKRIALAIGLEGKMRSTVPGDAFKAWFAKANLPALPHDALTAGLSNREPKQDARLLKAECQECGCVIRITRKWVEQADELRCPVCHEGSMVV